jgi:hypothetical protein
MEAPPLSPLPCIACGYDLASLSTRTCPECGYVVTAEDDALRARREFYLEATRHEAWLLPTLGACATVPLAMVVLEELGMMIGAMCAVVIGLAQVGGHIVSRNLPKFHRRVFRRAWWLGIISWSLIWLAVCSAVLYCANHIADYEVRSWIDERALVVVGAVLATASALTVPAWFLCWRRASRLAGVPETHRTKAVFRRGILPAAIPLVPVAATVVLGLIVTGSVALLDRVFPTWYMD